MVSNRLMAAIDSNQARLRFTGSQSSLLSGGTVSPSFTQLLLQRLIDRSLLAPPSCREAIADEVAGLHDGSHLDGVFELNEVSER